MSKKNSLRSCGSCRNIECGGHVSFYTKFVFKGNHKEKQKLLTVSLWELLANNCQNWKEKEEK